MKPNQYLKQYQKNQIETATPEKVLIMLYGGAIQFLNKAKKALQENNIEEINTNLIGAQKIITEFMNTLDIEKGGDMAKNLYNLYEYLHHRLVQANIKKDEKMVDEVLKHLSELKKTWEEAIIITAKEKKSKTTQENNTNKDYSV